MVPGFILAGLGIAAIIMRKYLVRENPWLSRPTTPKEEHRFFEGFGIVVGVLAVVGGIALIIWDALN